ncbi:MAG: fucose isomerase [Bacteroidales bacterium]|nr:fucose isomerase [Bacteroidales bacterium]
METLNLIAFASDRYAESGMKKTHEEFLSAIEASGMAVRFISPDDYVKKYTGEFCLVFISSGGCESKFAASYDKLPKPTVLLTDGLQNSFAASLEICSWVRQKGAECRIIHETGDQLVNTIWNMKRASDAKNALKGCKIGVIGEPSSWLIASGVDVNMAKKKWGVEYVNIPLSVIENGFECYTEDDTIDIAKRVLNGAKSIREPKKEDLYTAARLYKALKATIDRYELSAITLQCFSLIESCGTTGCLALSLLNDEGIVAGCEGDEQTVFTMLALQKLTGVSGFMCNPSSINKKENTVQVAHCTIGMKQVKSYEIRSHFESGKGVAIQGEMEKGVCTVAKIGGKGLNEIFVSRADMVENTKDEKVCRTQLLLKLEESVGYFLEKPIGNHHVVVKGDYVEALKEMM